LYSLGIITYVNNRIDSPTTIVKKCSEYLITRTGNLVVINCYLPQQGRFHTDHRYTDAIDEIIEVVDTIGNECSYILGGDFNSSGPNRPDFERLMETLDLYDVSKDIDYTFQCKRKDKISSTKIDYFLSKFLLKENVIKCNKTEGYYHHGGHSILQLYAAIPELEITDDCEDRPDPPEAPTYINFSKINPRSNETLVFEVDALMAMEELMSENSINRNPLKTAKSIMEKVGRIATAIFPQQQKTHAKPRVIGWTKYVKNAQQVFSLKREYWEKAGRPETGEYAEALAEAATYKADCIEEMVRQEQETLAEILCAQFTGGSDRDRSNCWKPLKNVTKGNCSATSPILSGIKDPQNIADFWADFYTEKMKGKKDPTLEDSDAFEKMCQNPFPKEEITTQDVINAIDKLKTDCAYYDEFSPKLFNVCGYLSQYKLKFAECFSILMTEFMNADTESMKKWLTEDEHFFVSYIRPILKGNLDPKIPKSYRPISVSHTLTALFERIITDKFFPENPPKNFFGYVPDRACDMAVHTLKSIVRTTETIDGKVLIFLDASGAFESVNWDRIFPRLIEKGLSSTIVRAIWLMYRFNRYETRWEKYHSKSYFYATGGTKQGGILSGKIFLEYMSFLNDRLDQLPGIVYQELIWNSLFYADDVVLICHNYAHAKQLLKACEDFEIEGFVKWNASKSVVVELSTKRKQIIPSTSSLTLNGVNLPQSLTAKYLGYMCNSRLTDDDMIQRQTRRLNALKNNISTQIPLDLLVDQRLREIACAYSGIYCLSIFDNYTVKTWSKLKAAHGRMIGEFTQFKDRDKVHWDPENGLFDNRNRIVYGRLRIKTFDTMVNNIKVGFENRFEEYIRGVRRASLRG
jgi:hypothetical protein